MDFSLSFLFTVFFIILPGLIYRRLFFYGEFSKQFSTGINLITLLALSSIPGIILSVISFFIYSYYVSSIDLAKVVDLLKDLNNPDFKIQDKNLKLNTIFSNDILPYIFFLYLTSLLSGILSGRLIRLLRLDIRYKLFRFKNIWFYLFNGQYSSFKKSKHLKQKNKKHLFTKADILIDTNSKTNLYSGIVIDYEISNEDSSVLTKLILQKAERYSIRDGVKKNVEIPGTLLVVDCNSMKNINLTYIYEDTKNILQSKFPNYIELLNAIIILLMIPIFIFKSESIDFGFYNNYFSLPWYKQILAFLFSIQLISITNPFIKIKNEYQFISLKTFLLKLLIVLILFYTLYKIT